MTTVLLTRPYPQSKKTAQKLKGLGLEVFLDPLMERELLPVQIYSHHRYQAILLTSMNALPALKNLKIALPIFTVGKATAEAVQEQGHIQKVTSADGTAKDLAQLIEGTLLPEDGPLLYLSGKEIQFDLTQQLAKKYFQVDRVVCYRMHPALTLLPSTRDLLTDQKLHWILFYSRRTAEIFVNIIKNESFASLLSEAKAGTLSQEISHVLKELPFQSIVTAAFPTEEHLLKELFLDPA
jgi:uroporphyrinogen-III synthase